MKTCSTCRQQKPLDAFHHNRSTLDGHHSTCKACRLARYHASRGAVVVTEPPWTGRVYGRWTVIGEPTGRHPNRFVSCRCECGTEKPVRCASLRATQSTACGCQRRRNHVRSPVAVRRSSSNAPCGQCAGLAHRRPRVGLCSCGQSYAEERRTTLDDVMRLPRDTGREVL